VFLKTLVALERAGLGLALVALKRTSCDMWQLECRASNVTASVQSDHLVHGYMLPVFFTTDQLHRPPCSAEIQPMSQQDASATWIGTRYTRALAAAKLGCTNLIFVQPGAKINGQYYRDMLLMQRLIRRSAALLETCLSSSKTMRQHIVPVTQSSFCAVRHRSSSVLTSTR